MAMVKKMHTHDYRIEVPVKSSAGLIECVQFEAPDAASALFKVERMVPSNIAVSMFEDERALGSVELLSKGFWAISGRAA